MILFTKYRQTDTLNTNIENNVNDIFMFHFWADIFFPQCIEKIHIRQLEKLVIYTLKHDHLILKKSSN